MAQMGAERNRGITKAQIKKIWALSRAAGLNEEGLRHLVDAMVGSHHLHDISKVAFSSLVDELKRRAEARHPMAAPVDGDEAMIEVALQVESAAQRALIGGLARKVQWRVEGGFRRWIKSSFGLDAIRTNEDVTKVKLGLLSILRQQRAKMKRPRQSTRTH